MTSVTQDKAHAVAIYLDLYVSERSNIKDTFEEYQYMPLKLLIYPP